MTHLQQIVFCVCLLFVCTRQLSREKDRNRERKIEKDTTCFEYNKNNTHNFPVSVSIFGYAHCVYPEHNGEKDNREKNNNNKKERKQNKRKMIETAVNLK